jgi:hypothetical protein
MKKRKPNSAHARLVRYSRAMLRSNHVAVIDLEASNLQAASQAALMENNAIALIELLEMLWSCNLEGANTVIDAVLQRLLQLRAAR